MGSRPSSHESRSRRSQSHAGLSVALRASAARLTIVARALARSRDVPVPMIPKKTSSGSRNWRGSTTPATRPATTTNLPARCVCRFRRIVGSSVRACCAKETMPAQVESPNSVEYESEESEESVATSSVGGAKKTAAKESTATKAGQVRLFCAQPAPSSRSGARRAVYPADFVGAGEGWPCGASVGRSARADAGARMAEAAASRPRSKAQGAARDE